MYIGEITTFNVIAKCPICENDTQIDQHEMRCEEAQCQHCDEVFEIGYSE